MTLAEIRKSRKKNLSPSDVADVLGCKPYTINVTVKERGLGAYPFELFWSGKWLRIPRAAFLNWAERNQIS